MSEESKSETGDGWREVVHIVNNIRKGHPYLDALEILCSAVEESDKWSERKRVLEAKAEAGEQAALSQTDYDNLVRDSMKWRSND